MTKRKNTNRLMDETKPKSVKNIGVTTVEKRELKLYKLKNKLK